VLTKDVIGLIVDAGDEAKQLTLFSEKSIFPAPISERRGEQKGGWVLAELEGEASTVEVQLEYVRLDGTTGRVVRQIDTRNDDAARNDDAGMAKAVVLKCYVDEVKKTLTDKSAKTFDAEFLSWFEEQSRRFDLAAQAEQLTQLQKAMSVQ
jgi:hypothetical protein